MLFSFFSILAQSKTMSSSIWLHCCFFSPSLLLSVLSAEHLRHIRALLKHDPCTWSKSYSGPLLVIIYQTYFWQITYLDIWNCFVIQEGYWLKCKIMDLQVQALVPISKTPPWSHWSSCLVSFVQHHCLSSWPLWLMAAEQTKSVNLQVQASTCFL